MSRPDADVRERLRALDPGLLALLEKPAEPDRWELRIALLPCLPLSLADRLGDRGVLRRFVGRGLVTVPGSYREEPAVVRAGVPVRNDILERHTLTHPADAGQRLWEVAVEAARASREVFWESIPRVLRYWATLVLALPRGVDLVVGAPRVCEQLQVGVSKALAPGGWREEARDWISAAQPLIPLFGPLLEQAITRADLELRRTYALEEDRSLLETFFQRPEPIERFLALLDAPKPTALHLLGPGGSGKSTLVRHLRIAPVEAPRQRRKVYGWYRERMKTGERYVAARIDFDHLSPDFPSRSPGLVLFVLADELRPSARSTAALGALARLEGLVGNREASGSLREGAPDDWRPGTLNASIVTSFLNFLDALDDRAVLFLDTCEEVERVGSPAEPSLALRALLAMVGALLSEAANRVGQASRVRVVFAGRRPLADSGGESAPWSLLGAAMGRGNLPWLDVYEVQGFDVEEARAYLRRRLPGRPAEVERLLEGCPAAPPSALTTAATGADLRRYLPFDLGLYADWASGPTPPSAEDLATGMARYVQVRLVDRAGSMGPVWPVLAAFGEADATLLELDDIPADEAAAILSGARQTDWAIRESGTALRGSSGAARVRLQTDLQLRVAEWGRAQAWRLDELRGRVLDRLAARFDAGAFDGLLEEHVVLLARHLGTSAWRPDPSVAHETWAMLVDRLGLVANPALAARLVERAGPLPRSSTMEVELRLLDAALRIGDADRPLPDLPDELGTEDPDVRARCAAHALAARAGVLLQPGRWLQPGDPTLVPRLARILESADLSHEQVAVAVLAATELVLDVLESASPEVRGDLPEIPPRPPPLAGEWALRAAWSLVSARAWLARGQLAPANAALIEGLSALESEATPVVRLGWNHDESGPELWNRLCLEMLAVADRAGLEVGRPTRPPYLQGTDAGLVSRLLGFYPAASPFVLTGDPPRRTRRRVVVSPAPALDAARAALSPGPESGRVAAESRLVDLHRASAAGSDVPPPDVAVPLRRVAITRRNDRGLPDELQRFDLLGSPDELADLATWHLLASRLAVTAWPPAKPWDAIYTHAALRVAHAADVLRPASEHALALLREQVFPFADLIAGSSSPGALLLTLDLLALVSGGAGRAEALARVRTAAERYRAWPRWYTRLVVPAEALAGRAPPPGLDPVLVLAELATLAVRWPEVAEGPLRAFAAGLEEPYLRLCAHTTAEMAAAPEHRDVPGLIEQVWRAWGLESPPPTTIEELMASAWAQEPIENGVDAALRSLLSPQWAISSVPRASWYGLPPFAWTEGDLVALSRIVGERPETGETRRGLQHPPPTAAREEEFVRAESRGGHVDRLLESAGDQAFVVEATSWRVALPLHPGAPYSATADRLRAAGVPSRTGRVALHLDAPSDSVAWEAAFQLWSQAPAVVRRRSRGGWGGPTANRILLHVGDAQGISLIAGRWSRSGAGGLLDIASPSEWGAFGGLEGGVVHLVGTAVLTRGTATLLPDQFGLRDRHGGLAASDLVRRQPSIVLLEPPAALVERREASDRLVAAGLRAYAGELARHGVPVVVVLPHLGQLASLVDPVLGAVIKSIGGEAPDWGAVLAAVRGSLLGALAGELREAAFDLVVYAPDRTP